MTCIVLLSVLFHYHSYNIYTCSYRTVSSFTPYLDDVFCIGSESRLEDCSHRAVFTSLSCSHSNDLAVICKGTMVSGESISNIL